MKRKEYQQYTEQLNGSYNDCFSQIEIILKEYGLVEYDNAMSEILDMVLCAQADHKDCDVIFGTDLKKFCKEYVDSLSPHHKLKALLALVMAFGALMIINGFLIAIWKRLDGTIHNLMYDSFNLFSMLGGLFGMLSAEVNSILNKNKSFSKTLRYRKKQYLIIFVIFALIGFVISYILGREDIKLMVCMADILPVMASVVLLGFSGYIAVDIADRRRDVIDSASMKSIRKLYERKKRKKGWTEQQFIDWYRKYYMFWVPFSLVIYMILMVMIFVIFTLSIIHNGFVAVFGLVLMLVIEVFFTSAIMAAGFSGKRIVNMLVKGSIPLYNEEHGEIL